MTLDVTGTQKDTMFQRTAGLRSWAESSMFVSSTICPLAPGLGHALDWGAAVPTPSHPTAVAFGSKVLF